MQSNLLFRPTRLTDEKFISKSNIVHNNKYDYSEVIYTNIKNKVIIHCPVHGKFEQTCYKHLKGQGCIKCRNENRSKTINRFIKDSKKLFADKFDYSKVNYKNGTTKIVLICSIHGEFEITPRYHLKSKYGCKQCAKDANRYNLFRFSDWEKAGLKSNNFDSFKVYVLKIFNKNESFIKIGKTFTTTTKRFEQTSKIPYVYEILKEYHGNAKEISNLEKKLHATFNSERYNPKLHFEGDTECFSVNITLQKIDDAVFKIFKTTAKK